MIDTGMLDSVLAAAALLWTPLALAAIGGLVNRVGGIVNIGLEGQMLIGALIGAVVSGATGSWALAVLAAAVAGTLGGLAMSLCITRLRANQIIAGLGFNIVVAGLVGYLLDSVFDVSATLRVDGLEPLPELDIPVIDDLPVVGAVVSGRDPLFWLAVLCVPAMSIWLRHTRAGLRLRATGSETDTAASLGLSVPWIRDRSGMVAGLAAGIAGAHLSLGQVGLFNQDMVAGRGFIALAAFYFGRSRPLPTALACVLFAVFDATQARLQIAGIATQLVQTLPYVVVMVVLTGAGIRGARARNRRTG